MLDDYLPATVNTGPWITAYTLNRLRELDSSQFVLPICSLGTRYAECASLGKIVLPPLYHEALDDELKSAILNRISVCFPVLNSKNNRDRLRVIELPEAPLPPAGASGKVLAFSVDTAVEEHGPYLPLGTDTIQSYSVLRQLAREIETLELQRPVDYGQLTWGLPFGFSIDLGAELLTRYVTGYANALAKWKSPLAMYVVDVHGSITHRKAVVQGLLNSHFQSWTFRWLHEPLAEFASERGDQHAGGVETALVERVSAALLDPMWWPSRIDDLAKEQMAFAKAVELTSNLERFGRYVAEHSLNGIIGDVRNYYHVNANVMFERMLSLARQDVHSLTGKR